MALLRAALLEIKVVHTQQSPTGSRAWPRAPAAPRERDGERAPSLGARPRRLPTITIPNYTRGHRRRLRGQSCTRSAQAAYRNTGK